MNSGKQYVVCVRNEGYEESLELRKIYEVLDDPEAVVDGLLRVVHEDEDYLYLFTRRLTARQGDG